MAASRASKTIATTPQMPRPALRGGGGGQRAAERDSKKVRHMQPVVAATKSCISSSPKACVAEKENTPCAVKPVARSRFVRVAPPLPLECLVHRPDLADTNSKTPTLTPHALTDIALRKSELLLAQLSALGLSDDEFGCKCDANEDQDSLSRSFCLQSAPSSASSISEVPVVLLDLFSETLSNAKTIDQWEFPEPHSEPESEELSTTASSSMIDGLEPESEEPSIAASLSTMDGLSSSDGSSAATSCLPSPCRDVEVTLDKDRCIQGHSVQPKSSVRVTEHRPNGVALPQQKAVSLGRPILQICQKVSARGTCFPVQVTVETPMGRGCTVQHTVTITSTVKFH